MAKKKSNVIKEIPGMKIERDLNTLTTRVIFEFTEEMLSTLPHGYFDGEHSIQTTSKAETAALRLHKLFAHLRKKGLLSTPVKETPPWHDVSVPPWDFTTKWGVDLDTSPKKAKKGPISAAVS